MTVVILASFRRLQAQRAKFQPALRAHAHRPEKLDPKQQDQRQHIAKARDRPPETRFGTMATANITTSPTPKRCICSSIQGRVLPPATE